MTIEQKIQQLLSVGIKESSFLTITVPINSTTGRPIAEGKCKAVILRFNNLNRNSLTSVPFQPIYYGDSTQQEMELLRGETSEIIFTKDLSNVYVRAPLFETELTAIIYE